MSEVRGGETYISYPSSKVPKFHVKSLSLPSTSVRPSFPALTPYGRLSDDENSLILIKFNKIKTEIERMRCGGTRIQLYISCRIVFRLAVIRP